MTRDPRVHTAGGRLAATPDRVFAALTDPAALAVWLPPAGMSGTVEWFRPGVGGGFRMVLDYLDPAVRQGKTTAGSDVVQVRTVELVDDVRVVWATDFDSADPAFAGTMTMTWSIEPDTAGTHLTVTARDVPAGIGEADHLTGMRSSIDQLRRYLEPDTAETGTG